MSGLIASDSPQKQVVPFMVVHRLFKAYGSLGENLALKVNFCRKGKYKTASEV